MYGKKLAYIVKIKDVVEIPSADRIELAHVLDYTVVVKKGEYRPGDLALYIEIDSVLPDGFTQEQKDTYKAIKDGSYFKGLAVSADETEAMLKRLRAESKYPYFEFLREKHFKIKSMKMTKFGVVSQGILFKPSDIGLVDVKLGDDFTEKFNITEIVQDAEEAGINTTARLNWMTEWLMRFAWFRKWRKAHRIAEVWDPSFPGKSDEENVQKIYTEMYKKYADKEWVATEKLEGQNITIYSEEVSGFFERKRKRIGVCSRTRELSPNGSGKSFWNTVKRLELDKTIERIPGEWFCRGEHVGPNIQGNIYKLPKTDVVFFDFYHKENGKWNKLNFEESVAFAKKWNLQFVPVLDEHYKLPATKYNDKDIPITGVDIMLQQADAPTVFGFNRKHKREGFVLRLRDDYNVSFKVKNPNYSI